MDPEISLGSKPAPAPLGSLPFYLGWLSGIPLLTFKIGMVIVCSLGLPETLRQRLCPFIRPSERREVALESALVLAVNIGILLLVIFVNPGFWGIVIGQVLGHCLLSSYLVMEHNGLPHEGSILEKTRSIRANGILRQVMWNMPYHAEHHAYPAVPFHALPQLHRQLKAELHHREGHLKFNSSLLKKFIGRKPTG